MQLTGHVIDIWLSYINSDLTHLVMIVAGDGQSRKTLTPNGKQQLRLVGLARASGDGALVATLHDILVLPELRGKGLGTQLLRRLLAQVGVVEHVSQSAHVIVCHSTYWINIFSVFALVHSCVFKAYGTWASSHHLKVLDSSKNLTSGQIRRGLPQCGYTLSVLLREYRRSRWHFWKKSLNKYFLVCRYVGINSSTVSF